MARYPGKKTGHNINIYADISGAGNAGYVLENDAGGTGLLCSGFLYLGRDGFPANDVHGFECAQNGQGN